MPLKLYKPTSPGRRFRQSVSTFEELTKGKSPSSALTRAARSAGPAATTRAASRRATAAAARSGSTGSSTSSATSSASRRASLSIEYDPNRSARIALLAVRRRREALHHRAGRPQGRRHRAARARRPKRAGQRAAAREHPDRHVDPQHRAEARPRRADGARGRRRRRSSWRRKASRRRSAFPRGEIRRRPGAAASRRSARSATSSTRTRSSARPGTSAAWASARRCAARHDAARPSPRRRRGQGAGRRPGETQWGKLACGIKTRRNKKHGSLHRLAKKREQVDDDVSVDEEGAVRRRQAHQEDRGAERAQREEGRARPGRAPRSIFPTMVGHTIAVHDGRRHVPDLRHREHGRPQARRVRADAHVPRPQPRQAAAETRRPHQ